jgi:hypothetical protein
MWPQSHTDDAPPPAHCCAHADERIERFLPSLRTIWDREICPTFRAYEFHPRDGKAFEVPALVPTVALPGPDTSVSGSAGLDDDDDDEDNDDHLLAPTAPEEMMMMMMAAGDDGGYSLGDGNDNNNDDDDDDGDVSEEASKGRRARLSDPGAPLVPSAAVKTQPGAMLLSMDAMAGSGTALALSAAALGSWAGPEHWRMRRLAQNGTLMRPFAPPVSGRH